MSTLDKILISDVLQIVSDLRGETTTNTDASRIRAVSRAERDFAGRMNWRCFLIKNLTMAGDTTNSYTIGSASYPMRMKGLNEVFVSSSTTTQESERYQVVDFNQFKELYNSNASLKLAYEYYDQANDVWKVYISPAPAATDTITYSYFYKPPVRTASSEYVVCPNPNIIAYLTLADVYEGEDESDAADRYKVLAEQLMRESMGKEEAPAVNQIYQMGAIEGMGIGTY
jgi:hypothetical protein